MHVISALKELSNFISSIKSNRKSIGFVPTMGALHNGHLALIQRSIKENNITVVSIFVNLLQFNNLDDFEKYPRVIEEDFKLLEKHKVDLVFTPDEKEFYPLDSLISMDFGYLSQTLEGEFRKGHLEGVGIAVSKFLHLIQPTYAYFGLKDLQQYLLVRRMCLDLNFPLDIVGVETVREDSGLALSSRNKRLSTEGIETASVIYRGLQGVKEGIDKNEPLDSLLSKTRSIYDRESGFELEYLEAVHPLNLLSVDSYTNLSELAICVAGYVEGIRLIDNLYLQLE